MIFTTKQFSTNFWRWGDGGVIKIIVLANDVKLPEKSLTTFNLTRKNAELGYFGKF